jgi:hypothetical protein
MALSIGEVAGLINVGVVFCMPQISWETRIWLTFSRVQLTFPLALVFILVGIIANENNAVTWYAQDTFGVWQLNF